MPDNKVQNSFFPKGYYDFHKKQLFNYQLNRWYSLGLADFEDFKLTAEKINSFENWKTEMERLAEKALSENRIMNAAIYYRAAEFYTFNKDQKEKLYDQFYELFYRAISDEKIEKLKIPYKAGYLPAIRLSPEKEEKGTIILHGGFDSFIEEFYYLIKYLKTHGYQVIAFEGPGQGNVLIKQEIALDYKWEKAVKEILDCLHLTDVSIFGISMGGLVCFKSSSL
jgi:pimeloyl-ACP methyl ester carboxylesterase